MTKSDQPQDLSTPRLCIVAPAFNEASNLPDFVERVKAVLAELPDWQSEIIIVDNCSTDDSLQVLVELHQKHPEVKAVLNAWNCGHLVNQFQALIHGEGQVVILLAADLQDPPELILPLVEEYLQGSPVVLLQKAKSDEATWMFRLREFFYRMMEKISETPHFRQVNGAGLYDQRVVELLRQVPVQVPYLRGLLGQLGIEPTLLSFEQPLRKAGRSKNNLWSLFDLALLGLVSCSQFPVRLALLVGAFLMPLAAAVSWMDSGIAFFLGLSGFTIFFSALMAEYSVRSLRQMPRGPRVLEKGRIGFSYQVFEVPELFKPTEPPELPKAHVEATVEATMAQNFLSELSFSKNPNFLAPSQNETEKGT